MKIKEFLSELLNDITEDNVICPDDPDLIYDASTKLEICLDRYEYLFDGSITDPIKYRYTKWEPEPKPVNWKDAMKWEKEQRKHNELYHNSVYTFLKGLHAMLKISKDRNDTLDTFIQLNSDALKNLSLQNDNFTESVYRWDTINSSHGYWDTHCAKYGGSEDCRGWDFQSSRCECGNQKIDWGDII